MRVVHIAPTAFVALLLFFLVFRTFLIAIPFDVIDAFAKARIGALTALTLLLIQPFACRRVAQRFGAQRSVAWWVFAAGVLSSALLFFPAMVLFME